MTIKRLIFIGALLLGVGYGLYKLSLVYTAMQLFVTGFILVSMFGIVMLMFRTKGVLYSG